jgi:hypothetical protein
VEDLQHPATGGFEGARPMLDSVCGMNEWKLFISEAVSALGLVRQPGI